MQSFHYLKIGSFLFKSSSRFIILIDFLDLVPVDVKPREINSPCYYCYRNIEIKAFL
jgi:hypothetical protein